MKSIFNFTSGVKQVAKDIVNGFDDRNFNHGAHANLGVTALAIVGGTASVVLGLAFVGAALPICTGLVISNASFAYVTGRQMRKEGFPASVWK